MNISNIIGYENFTNFEISIDGELRNLKTGHSLRGSFNSSGYKSYQLRQSGNSKQAMQHRLIAELFVYNPDNKNYIDHINGNINDNDVENLRWCTPKENSQNVRLSSRNKSGELNISKTKMKRKNGAWNYFWRVSFSSGKNQIQKHFLRDPDCDVIPKEIIEWRNEKSRELKGEFCPLN